MREKLVENFLRIASIPRNSGEEDDIADFFAQIAKKNNYFYLKDENNNVLIRKEGSKKSAPVALQAHLDMVFVNDDNVDTKDISVVINGDSVTAKGTSLGADQGVGLAMMLTLLEDKSLIHPDLEFLFTVEEETTFRGAVTFPYDKVKSRRMINLDNADDESVFIGADGDICNEYCYRGKQEKNTLPSYFISIDHFPGGNSGVDVNLSKNTAIICMAKHLFGRDIYLKSIDGGTSENDLATSCQVILNTSLSIEKIFEDIPAKINKVENTTVFSKEDTQNILKQILDLPSGFFSDDNASANLGVIKTSGNEVKIEYVFRSMQGELLFDIQKNLKSLSNHFDVTVVYEDSVWKIDKNSQLLKKYKDLYFKKYSQYPKEEIAHSGIECSAIKKRIDHLDIISIGASIKKYHTVEEETYISSWLKVYDLLLDFLEIL